MTWMATSDRIRGVQGRGRMAEAWVPSSLTHSLSRLPPSHRPPWVRIPPPALGRTVNAARIPASFSFLGGVGTMGAIICCHGAQRSGSYQSISYQSRSREEPMKEILPHWHFSPNAPVKDVDTKGMTRGDRAVAEACVGRWRPRRGRSWRSSNRWACGSPDWWAGSCPRWRLRCWR